MVRASGKDAHWVPPLGGVPGDLREDPGLGGEIISQHWPGNASGSPRQSWSMWLGKGKSGAPCLSCCPRDPTPEMRMKMDGWMENRAPCVIS